jgi:hypothetical protein
MRFNTSVEVYSHSGLRYRVPASRAQRMVSNGALIVSKRRKVIIAILLPAEYAENIDPDFRNPKRHTSTVKLGARSKQTSNQPITQPTQRAYPHGMRIVDRIPANETDCRAGGTKRQVA